MIEVLALTDCYYNEDGRYHILKAGQKGHMTRANVDCFLSMKAIHVVSVPAAEEIAAEASVNPVAPATPDTPSPDEAGRSAGRRGLLSLGRKQK